MVNIFANARSIILNIAFIVNFVHSLYRFLFLKISYIRDIKIFLINLNVYAHTKN